MTEQQWALTRENLTLKMTLYQAQAALLQRQFDEAAAALQAMGEKWEPALREVKDAAE
jgi:hypothetical protein